MATNSSDAFHIRRWNNFVDRLHASLKEVGLEADVDYWFQQRHGLDPTNLIEMQSVDQITPDVLVACANATAHDATWNVIIAVTDESTGNLRPMVHANGGMFTLLGGGGAMQKTIQEATRKRGDSWMK